MKQPETPTPTLQYVVDADDAVVHDAPVKEAALLRRLRRLLGSKRARPCPSAPLPIYRITRDAPDRWVLERPGASVEHAFATLEDVVVFIRHECLYNPATVELRIDDLYVVSELDPSKPCSLFGEAAS